MDSCSMKNVDTSSDIVSLSNENQSFDSGVNSDEMSADACRRNADIDGISKDFTSVIHMSDTNVNTDRHSIDNEDPEGHNEDASSVDNPRVDSGCIGSDNTCSRNNNDKGGDNFGMDIENLRTADDTGISVVEDDSDVNSDERSADACRRNADIDGISKDFTSVTHMSDTNVNTDRHNIDNEDPEGHNEDVSSVDNPRVDSGCIGSDNTCSGNSNDKDGDHFGMDIENSRTADDTGISVVEDDRDVNSDERSADACRRNADIDGISKNFTSVTHNMSDTNINTSRHSIDNGDPEGHNVEASSIDNPRVDSGCIGNDNICSGQGVDNYGMYIENSRTADDTGISVVEDDSDVESVVIKEEISDVDEQEDYLRLESHFCDPIPIEISNDEAEDFAIEKPLLKRRRSNQWYSCEFCEKHFRFQKGLNKHILCCHSANNKVTNSEIYSVSNKDKNIDVPRLTDRDLDTDDDSYEDSATYEESHNVTFDEKFVFIDSSSGKTDDDDDDYSVVKSPAKRQKSKQRYKLPGKQPESLAKRKRSKSEPCFSCKFCDKIYRYEKALAGHVRKEHLTRKKKPDTPKIFSISDKDKNIDVPSLNDKDLGTDDGRFEDTSTNEAHKQQSELHKPLAKRKRSKSEQLFSCKSCDKIYKYEKALTGHIRKCCPTRKEKLDNRVMLSASEKDKNIDEPTLNDKDFDTDGGRFEDSATREGAHEVSFADELIFSDSSSRKTDDDEDEDYSIEKPLIIRQKSKEQFNPPAKHLQQMAKRKRGRPRGSCKKSKASGRHMGVKSEQLFSCKFCDKIYSYEKALAGHIRKRHPDKEDTLDTREMFNNVSDKDKDIKEPILNDKDLDTKDGNAEDSVTNKEAHDIVFVDELIFSDSSSSKADDEEDVNDVDADAEDYSMGKPSAIRRKLKKQFKPPAKHPPKMAKRKRGRPKGIKSEQLYNCKFCDKIYSYEKALAGHIRKCHPEREEVLDTREKFNNVNDKDRDMEEPILNDKDLDIDDGRFEDSATNEKEHDIVFAEELIFNDSSSSYMEDNDDEDDEDFKLQYTSPAKQPQKLAKRTRTLSDRLYSCKYCDKIYRYQKSLTGHIRKSHRAGKKKLNAHTPSAISGNKSMEKQGPIDKDIVDDDVEQNISEEVAPASVCEICDKSYRYQKSLESHMRRCHPESVENIDPEIPCLDNSRDESTNLSLNNEMNVVNDSFQHNAADGGVPSEVLPVLYYFSELSASEENDDSDDDYTMVKPSSRHLKLKKSCKLPAKDLSYSCKFCYNMYSYKKGLDRHMRKCHPPIKKEFDPDNDDVTAVDGSREHNTGNEAEPCGVLSMESNFNNSSNMMEYVEDKDIPEIDLTVQKPPRKRRRRHKSKDWYECTDCDNKYKWKKGLKRHRLRAHLKGMEESMDKKKVKSEDVKSDKHLGLKDKDVNVMDEGVEHNTDDEAEHSGTSSDEADIDDLLNKIGKEEDEDITAKNFSDIKLPRKRRRRHKSKDWYDCEDCESRYKWKKGLERHIRRTHPEKFMYPYNCNMCGMGLLRRQNYIVHMKNHERDSKGFDCDICGSSFNSKDDIRHHISRVHGERSTPSTPKDKEKSPRVFFSKSFRCELCSKHYVREEALNEHMAAAHPDPITEDCIVNCLICGKMLEGKSALVEHVATHTEPPFKCELCQVEYRSIRSIKDHVSTHFYGKLVCDICGKAVSGSRNLQRHMKVHCDDVNFLCSTCGMGFNDRRKFERHEQRHLNMPVIKPLSCEVCGKAFRDRYNLNSHMNKHSVVKAHQCNICGRGLGDKRALKLHMARHNGENQFKCPVCEKTFAYASYASVHMRSHTMEKPYECEECGNSFTQKSSLNTHMKSHSGEKNFTCIVCGKSFLLLQYLKVHMHTHTGEKPYLCEICQKGFSQPSSLRTHMLTCC